MDELYVDERILKSGLGGGVITVQTVNAIRRSLKLQFMRHVRRKFFNPFSKS